MRPLSKLQALFEELRRSVTGKGLGRFPVYSAMVYLSRTKHRGASPETDATQDVIEQIKAGDNHAIKEGAAALARHAGLRGFKGVVTGAPRSAAGRPSNMKLAKALVKAGVGKRAVDLVERAIAVQSSRMRRRAGGVEAGTGYQEHVRSMAVKGVPEADGVLIVDDVFTSGATLRAAADVLHQAGFRGPVFGATVAHYSSDPKAKQRASVFYV